MEIIALDNQPFSIVEKQGFHQLIEHTEPCYSLPSRHHFSDVSLPVLHDIVATHIQKLLDGSVSDISFMKDIWSSNVSQTSMLSLTAQWIDDNFEIKRAQKFPGSHTGTAIANAFNSMLTHWKILTENVSVAICERMNCLILKDWAAWLIHYSSQ